MSDFTLAFQYLDDRTHGIRYTEGQLPADIAITHEVQAGVQACNNSGQSVTFKILIWFQDQNGQQYGLRAWEGVRNHTWCYALPTIPFNLNSLGNWTLRAQLYVNGVLNINKSWSAIKCVQNGTPPPVDVSLGFWTLTDRTTWEHYTEEQLPPDLYEGHSVYASCIARNHGVADVSYTMKLWLKDPNGQTRGPKEYSGTIKPGFNVSAYCTPVDLNMLGYWKFYGQLYINGSLWAEDYWTVLRCIEYAYPDPEGTIAFWRTRNVDTGKEYASRPITLEVGTRIQGTTYGHNTNYLDQYMKTIVWLVDPSGAVRGQHETAWTKIGPGSAQYTSTKDTVLDKPGNWWLHAKLYAEVKKNGSTGSGTLVDSGYWHIVTAEEAPPPPPPPEYQCPYCGAIFDTEEALYAHIESDHPGLPPPDGDGTDLEKYLKWGLIGGGAILVAAFVIRPLIRGASKKRRAE